MLRGNLSFFFLIIISFFLSPSNQLDSFMSSSSLPRWHPSTESSHGQKSCRHKGFFHSFNSIPGIGISLGSSLLVVLIFYMTFLLPRGPLLLNSPKWSISANYASSLPTSDESPSLLPDVLSLEQIRDIAAPTRGFYLRDYSLYLGWNNVSLRAAIEFEPNAENPIIDAIYSH